MCRKTLVVFLLLLTFVFPLTALAQSVPPIPSVYKGTVKDHNGNPVLSGRVNAYINDILRGSVGFTNGSYKQLVVSGDQNTHNKIVKFTVTARNVELDAVSSTQIKWQEGKISGQDMNNVNITVNTSSLPPLAPGDVNQDGAVNILDVQLVINFVMEKSKPIGSQFNASDMDKNESLNILDVVRIINIIMER